MVGKTRRDRCKILDIRNYLGIKCSIVDLIQKRRLNWFGHVARRGVYRSYKEEFPGKRPSGRPLNRWADQIRQEMIQCLWTIERTAADRDRSMEKVCQQKKCEDLKKIMQSQVKWGDMQVRNKNGRKGKTKLCLSNPRIFYSVTMRDTMRNLTFFLGNFI